MSVLSGNTLRELGKKGFLVDPFIFDKQIFNGMSYGCSLAGYDIRIREDVTMTNGAFTLASSIEKFWMPNNVIGFVHDKSSWARKGLSLFNTVIEPGWQGYLTLELVFHGLGYKLESLGENTKLMSRQFEPLIIPAGSPIAQIVFMYTDDETEGYSGKYQNQQQGPQAAIFERTSP